MFLRTPLEILSDSSGKDVSGVKLGINELSPKGMWDENQTIIDTGCTETIDCGLVLRSIGYKSIGRKKYKWKLGAIPYTSKMEPLKNLRRVYTPQ